MTYTIAPAAKFILADADRVAPGRNKASDGTIGDTAHINQGAASDHNPAPITGIVHAADVTNDPAKGMDTWHWAQIIAGRMAAGLETRVKYLVSNNGEHDVIFNLAVTAAWRLNGTGGSHGNHLHTSILYTYAAENNTTPFFVEAHQSDPITEVSMEPMDVIWYVNQLHSFWIDRAGHLQHAFDPGGSENLSVKVAPVEHLSIKHGVKCIINPATLKLEVHTVSSGDYGQIIFQSNSKGEWAAVRINNK